MAARGPLSPKGHHPERVVTELRSYILTSATPETKYMGSGDKEVISNLESLMGTIRAHAEKDFNIDFNTGDEAKWGKMFKDGTYVSAIRPDTLVYSTTNTSLRVSDIIAIFIRRACRVWVSLAQCGTSCCSHIRFESRR